MDIEKIRSSILAYCEEVCPKIDQVYFVEDIAATLQRCQFLTRPDDVWELLVGGKTTIIWANTEGIEIVRAYRLLGLAERDAVAAEKARLLKRYKARIKRLRADDAETHRIQIEVKDERIAELQARNTALVEALEKIKQEHGYRYTYGDGFGNVVEKRINSVGVAVDNALAANTEKGGENG